MTSEDEPFCIIYTDEDGEVTLETLTRFELESRLNEGEWGHAPFFGDGPSYDLASKCGLWIIRGSIVVPKIVTTIKQWSMGDK